MDLLKTDFLNIFTFFLIRVYMVYGNNDCRATVENNNVRTIEWAYLKDCLITINGEDVTKNTSENIWRLMKVNICRLRNTRAYFQAFENIENIPSKAYKYMGYSLTAIPIDDLHNISMENVEIVEAFGAIKSNNIQLQQQQQQQQSQGFDEEKLKILAQKIQSEWSNKGPAIYSEYDLKAMGEILCYFNTTDIQNIHADAFKEAAQWIGEIQKCPHEGLQALAKLAKSPQAFGEPQSWSTLEVVTIGNVINGLQQVELNSIEKNKLQLNNFYKGGHINTARNKNQLNKKPSTQAD